MAVQTLDPETRAGGPQTEAGVLARRNAGRSVLRLVAAAETHVVAGTLANLACPRTWRQEREWSRDLKRL